MGTKKPEPPQPRAATPARPGRKAAPAAPAKRGPAARVTATTPAAKQRLTVAAGLPGWRGVQRVLGEALVAGATALFVDSRGQAVTVRRRSGSAWQPPGPLGGADAAAVVTALAKLAAAGDDDPGFVINAPKLARRTCRVEARKAAQGEQILVLVGAELPRPERPRVGRLIGAVLGRVMSKVWRRGPATPDRDPTLPVVDLEATGPGAEERQAAAEQSDGYVAACDLVAAAVRDRAQSIVVESGPQGPAARFDVDGVDHPVGGLEAADVGQAAGSLAVVAGIDPRAKGPASGRVTALVQGKAWPCTVTAWHAKSAGHVEVTIDHVRPKFKTLADLGLPEAVVAGLRDLLMLESGLILLAAPRRNGLSTLFDGVIGAADRLLRDFVLLEDAATPRPEIANVKPERWDARTGCPPAAALEVALREQPNVLATCDLEDKELARGLVAQAGEGRLVIAAIRGADAVDGVARLAALGVDPRLLSRVLLGTVGVRLMRKLCPKCRQEYLPAVQDLAHRKLDPEAVLTLFRAPASGCTVCTGTGYLGRFAIGEFGAGPSLRAAVAKAVNPQDLRQAAATDGMVSMRRAALDAASRGVTSIEEVERLFPKA